MRNNRRAFTSFPYCLFLFFLFFLFVKISGWLVSLATGDTADFNNYFIYLIKEFLLVCFCVVLVFFSGQAHIFHRKGSGILKGIWIGFYYVFMASVTLVINLFLEEVERKLQPWYMILAFLLCMICVGIAEEVFFRGVLAEILYQRFAVDRAGIWKAAILSGLFFGIIHLSNLSFGEPKGVLIQVAGASISGMVFTAVYYRSGNIWATVLLHSYIDMAALSLSGIYGCGTVKDMVSEYEPLKLVGMVPHVLVLLVLLRKKKIGEVERNMAIRKN